MLSGELCNNGMRGQRSNFNAMAVASVLKPEFTSRVDSSRDLAMKTRDLGWLWRWGVAQRPRTFAAGWPDRV
jgi:hypothetical protein